MQDGFKEEQWILHLTSFYQASLEPAGDTSYGFLSFTELPAICHFYASVGQEQAWVVFGIQLKPPKERLQEGNLNKEENNKTSP